VLPHSKRRLRNSYALTTGSVRVQEVTLEQHLPNVTMNNPITETAVWATQYYLDVSSVYGILQVQGWSIGNISNLQFNFTTSRRTRHTIHIKSMVRNGANSYTGTLQLTLVTMNNPISETASWQAHTTYSYLNYGSPTGQGCIRR